MSSKVNQSTPTAASNSKETLDDNHISLAEFDLHGSHLGSGSYSQVSLIKRYYDQKNYALKTVDKKKVVKNHAIKYTLMERRVMLQISHPHIIKLHWTTKDASNVYFIYEYAENGELWTFLQKCAERRLPITILRAWAAQILYTLSYLHRQVQVSHRDLKPENILLDKNFRLVLADFGTSKYWDEAKGEASRRERNIQKAAKQFDSNNTKVRPESNVDRTQESYNLGNSNIQYIDNPEYQDDTPAIVPSNTASSTTPSATSPTTSSSTESDDDNSSETISDEEHRRRSILYRASRTNTFTGTAQYMAPELINSKLPTCVSDGDIWAFGIMLYQFAIGSLPYHEKTDYLTFEAVLAGDRTFLDEFMALGNQNEEWKDLCDLIGTLLTVCNEKRPRSHLDILNHPFFKPLLTENIYSKLQDLREQKQERENDDSKSAHDEFYSDLEKHDDDFWNLIDDEANAIIQKHAPTLQSIADQEYIAKYENVKKVKPADMETLDETF